MRKSILGLVLLISANFAFANTMICTLEKMGTVVLKIERDGYFLKAIKVLDLSRPERIADTLVGITGESVEKGDFYRGILTTDEYFKKDAELEIEIKDTDRRNNAKVKIGKGLLKKRLKASCNYN